MDLEQVRQLVQTKRTPSPARSKGGRRPRRSHQEDNQKEILQTISSKTISSKEIPAKTQQTLLVPL